MDPRAKPEDDKCSGHSRDPPAGGGNPDLGPPKRICSYKSLHPGLFSSINLIFQRRFHFFWKIEYKHNKIYQIYEVIIAWIPAGVYPRGGGGGNDIGEGGNDLGEKAGMTLGRKGRE